MLMESIELQALEMGEVGKRTLCEVCLPMAKEKIQREPELILSLENCASINVFDTFVIEQEEPCEARVSSTVL